MDIDPLSLPIGANPKKDMVIGFDELGEPIRRTAFGAEYSVTPQAVTGGSRLKPMARAVADDPMGSIGGALKALGSGAWDAISMPGRAAAGETPTYGQALDTLGMISAGSIPFPKPAGALGANSFKAYHGSPHDFDRFSMDKIGTGEGAQAYGHGLYFAENEAVAKGYKDALAHKVSTVTVDGQSKTFSNSIQESGPEEIATLLSAQALTDGQGLFAARMKARNMLLKAESGDLTAFQREAGWGDAEKMRKALEIIEDWEKRDVKLTPPGRMYEVQINADPDTFLDWDKPLSEQPQIAQRLGVDPNANARRAAEIRARVEEDMRLDGRMTPDEIDQRNLDIAAQMELQSATGDASSYAPRSMRMVEELKAKGIPGIKYKDAGSRGAGGSGTRNFVVFDDSLISILRKYGLVPGMFSAGLYASQPSSKEELQNYLGGL